jgi:hypothetical protein
MMKLIWEGLTLREMLMKINLRCKALKEINMVRNVSLRSCQSIWTS